MSGPIISSNPFDFSLSGKDYSDMLESNSIIEKIRSKNSRLADELSNQRMQPEYLKEVLAKMSPPAPKISFSLPAKESELTGHIYGIDELIVINFNRRQTKEVTAAFTVINNSSAEMSIDIGMVTLRAMEAVFNTYGRTIYEMEAVNYLQVLFIKNMANIRYKHQLLEFLRTIPSENEIVNKIVYKLAELCEAA